jgi:hypothetical protein
MSKRKINPHKGGRSSDLHVRIKPNYHDMLRQICKVRDISMADWIESHIKVDFTQYNKPTQRKA